MDDDKIKKLEKTPEMRAVVKAIICSALYFVYMCLAFVAWIVFKNKITLFLLLGSIPIMVALLVCVVLTIWLLKQEVKKIKEEE